MMKRNILLLVAVMVGCTLLTAQTSQKADEGYVFISNLKTYSQQSIKSKVKTTISAGRVAVKGENNDYGFHCSDAVEYMTIGSGSFHRYYPLAQDIVEAEFISSAAFRKAARKVSISHQVPSSWQTGKVYSFKAACPDAYVQSLSVKPLRLSGDNVTLVTKVDEDFKPLSSIGISGETIIEISLGEEKVYLYNGQQVVPARNLGGNDYCTLVIDDNGMPYSESEESGRRADPQLSYVFGEIPMIDYFGWISAKEFVVDSTVYVAE